MFRLASMLYSIVGTSLAGAFIVAALTMGYDTLIPIIIAAVAGGILALPLAWLIARAILQNKV